MFACSAPSLNHLPCLWVHGIHTIIIPSPPPAALDLSWLSQHHSGIRLRGGKWERVAIATLHSDGMGRAEQSGAGSCALGAGLARLVKLSGGRSSSSRASRAQLPSQVTQVNDKKKSLSSDPYIKNASRAVLLRDISV